MAANDPTITSPNAKSIAQTVVLGLTTAAGGAAGVAIGAGNLEGAGVLGVLALVGAYIVIHT